VRAPKDVKRLPDRLGLLLADVRNVGEIPSGVGVVRELADRGVSRFLQDSKNAFRQRPNRRRRFTLPSAMVQAILAVTSFSVGCI
jgi:hypothetical protein